MRVLAGMSDCGHGRQDPAMCPHCNGTNDQHFLFNCSFCAKSRDEVDTIIVGPRVSICNFCIELANEVIAHEKAIKDEQQSGQEKASTDGKGTGSGEALPPYLRNQS